MLRKLLRLLFGSTTEQQQAEASAGARSHPEATQHPQPGTLDGYDLNTAAGWSPARTTAPSRSDSPIEQTASRSRAEIQDAALKRRESRKEHAARLHAEDIVFLGRGVSCGLADRRSDQERLSSLNLPVLSTPTQVATAMKMTIPKLRWLAYHRKVVSRSHYYTFEIARRNGKPRTLQAPHRTLACAQGWILDEILCHLPTHDAAHGFIRERSVVTNARPHLGAHTVINMDLTDYFPSITFPRVSGLFRSMGYSPAVATIFALLCTESPRQEFVFEGIRYFGEIGPRALPQGACTSPAISNLISRSLDCRLQGLAEKLGWVYTRYADDVTWSSNEEPNPSVGYVMARIRHIAEDEGFAINHEKTRVLRRNQRQSVTGIAVNDRLSVPRSTVRRIRAILHNAQFTGLAAQNRDNHPHFEHWLLGMIGWIHMVQPETGDKLRAHFDQLQDS
jgi:RNA-directed DNA polymerase